MRVLTESVLTESNAQMAQTEGHLHRYWQARDGRVETSSMTETGAEETGRNEVCFQNPGSPEAQTGGAMVEKVHSCAKIPKPRSRPQAPDRSPPGTSTGNPTENLREP